MGGARAGWWSLPGRRARVWLVVAGLAALGSAPAQPESPLPRFRAGANLVHVDAYVSAGGTAVTDLAADDFEIFEDDRPQTIEAFRLVRPGERTARTPAAAGLPAPREPAAVPSDPDARLFVVYLDYWHLGAGGSSEAEALAGFLQQAIGPGDLVGVMTPDITPENMTFARHGSGLAETLQAAGAVGQQDQAASLDERESEIRACYADAGTTAGIASEMIGRRREQRVLRSLDATIGHLASLRDERKFLILISEGWSQFRRNDDLARPLDGNPVPGGRAFAGAGSAGRPATGLDGSDVRGGAGYDSCERERMMLAYIDHPLEIRQIAQRANRAGVSVYPVDPRGAGLYAAVSAAPAPSGPAGRDGLAPAARHDGLRVLADQSDGVAALSAAETGPWPTRIVADTGPYYLLSYYSTAARLDGRFRRITVRVKRDGADVRTRPGYLAPTDAEARAAGGGATAAAPGTKPAPSSAVSRALSLLPAVRTAVAVRVHAIGLAGRVRAVVELDPETTRQPQWQTGGTLQVALEPEKGGQPTTWTEDLAPSRRVLVVDGPSGPPLAAGRYMVRVEGRPSRPGASIRASVPVVLRESGVGESVLVLRRGPATGLAYQPSADPRFRRTERLRAELPVLAPALTVTGRVLTREGQPLPLQVTIGERVDEPTGTRLVVAEVGLAPLAQGDYVLELTAGRDVVAHAFRVVP